MFRKSYFTRIRSRTPANSDDGTIYNNILLLRIIARLIANLKIFKRKEQELEQPSNQNHSKPHKTMFLPQTTLKTTM